MAELARQRLVTWMAANPKITQTAIAKAVGVSQSWVSLYMGGHQDADVDQLEAMARVFNHTLMELLDLRPDPSENELIEAYRALPVEKRELARKAVEAMVSGPLRARRRNDTR